MHQMHSVVLHYLLWIFLKSAILYLFDCHTHCWQVSTFIAQDFLKEKCTH